MATLYHEASPDQRPEAVGENGTIRFRLGERIAADFQGLILGRAEWLVCRDYLGREVLCAVGSKGKGHAMIGRGSLQRAHRRR
jgi:hypothetical protein